MAYSPLLLAGWTDKEIKNYELKIRGKEMRERMRLGIRGNNYNFNFNNKNIKTIIFNFLIFHHF